MFKNYNLTKQTRVSFIISLFCFLTLISLGTNIFGLSAANFTGKWKTNYGTMTLRQTSDGSVTGQYDNAGTIGDIGGSASGAQLKGTWADASGKGRITFNLSADGNSFTGKWGRSEGKGEAGGDWNGQRIH